MSVIYNVAHRTVPAYDTRKERPFHPGLVRWLGYDVNLQALYTSRQALSQWWPGGMTTVAGTLGEQYAGQWLFPMPVHTTRLIVELGGYATVAGGTTWRLYSDRTLFTGTVTGSATVSAVTIAGTSHAFTAPAFLTVTAFDMPGDRKWFTWLRLTGENLNSVAQGRLWTMHVRPAPDTPTMDGG